MSACFSLTARLQQEEEEEQQQQDQLKSNSYSIKTPRSEGKVDRKKMSRRIIIDELEFEVPYGKLAAKTWHEETDECKRVLFLHGWMDNAGSFDNIVPRLKYKDGLYIVALDLPGHGKSSQLPPGSSYSDLNIVMEIRRCLTELKWIQPMPKKLLNGDGGSPRPGGGRITSSGSTSSIGSLNNSGGQLHKKFTIIGHSLGAGLGLFYSSLYPKDVEEVVLLDFIKARTPSVDEMLQDTAETIDQFIETVPSQSPFSSPVMSRPTVHSSHSNKQVDKGQVIVSQEAAIVATIEAHRQLGALTRDDATCLLKRSTVAVSTPPNCVIYSRDLRLQSMLNLREHIEIHKVMFARATCRILIIVGKRGMYAADKYFRDHMEDVEQFYRERAKSLHLQWIDADHYLHMNRPQETAEIINRYLEAPADFQVKVD